MAIKFNCPGCNRVLTAPVEAVGKRAKCSGCGEKVTVPSPSEASAVVAAVAAPSAPAAPSPAPPRRVADPPSAPVAPPPVAPVAAKPATRPVVPPVVAPPLPEVATVAPVPSTPPPVRTPSAADEDAAPEHGESRFAAAQARMAALNQSMNVFAVLALVGSAFALAISLFSNVGLALSIGTAMLAAFAIFVACFRRGQGVIYAVIAIALSVAGFWLAANRAGEQVRQQRAAKAAAAPASAEKK